MHARTHGRTHTRISKSWLNLFKMFSFLSFFFSFFLFLFSATKTKLFYSPQYNHLDHPCGAPGRSRRGLHWYCILFQILQRESWTEEVYTYILYSISDPAKEKLDGGCSGSGQGTCEDGYAECTGSAAKKCSCKSGYQAASGSCGKCFLLLYDS